MSCKAIDNDSAYASTPSEDVLLLSDASSNRSCDPRNQGHDENINLNVENSCRADSMGCPQESLAGGNGIWKRLHDLLEEILPGGRCYEDSKENNSNIINGSISSIVRPLRMCVLQSKPDGTVYADDDSPADLLTHFQRAGYTPDKVQIETVYLTKQNYAATLIQLATKRCNRIRRVDTDIDCFLNLCDGAWDEPSVGIEVVDLLEHKLQVPFTGANVSFFEPTRLEMKKAALSCNVNVPAWRFVYSQEELQLLLQELDRFSNSGETCCGFHDNGTLLVPLRFPLLVKHFASYSSVGLIKESKVWNVVDLKCQCSRMIDTFGGCLVEEFIVGREFTILVSQYVASNGQIDVMAYEPIECRFGPGEDFKHYNLKWVDFENMSWQPTTTAESELAARMKQMSIDVFNSLSGRGYGRIDVRTDISSEIYFLEINPNCGVFYPPGSYGSADYILNRHDAIAGHAHFALQQIEVACKIWRREQDQMTSISARYNPASKSWGLFAQRDISVNEVIQYNEEAAICVVTKSHILKHWSNCDISPPLIKTGSPVVAEPETEDQCNGTSKIEPRKSSGTNIHHSYENFRSYCWPLSDNLFAMWHRQPDKWRPINHSCEPNAWFESTNSLNVVSRCPIKAGEEITMEYATFCGYFPEMKQFSCTCGSKNCRGVITGMDIIKYPDLRIIYADRMTDYVAQKARPFQE
jgi:D-ala D-ala ligase C-terminus/SET domain